MKVIGIYGSPRQGGNSDILLDKAILGARTAGADVERIYARDLNICGCLECGACDNTGVCVVEDDMQSVYPLLAEAQVILVATPIFFYGLPAQLKAVVDRCQAMWNKRLLNKTADERKTHDSGKGYLIAVGATRGQNLFEGSELTIKYFLDALDMSYKGGIFFKRIEHKGAILEHANALANAQELGEKSVKS